MSDITVIIPIVHNELLAYYWELAMAALDSVFYQTVRPELIVSVEDTLAQAKNKGVEKANTEWCVFLDADDTLGANFIELARPHDNDVGLMKPQVYLNGRFLHLGKSDLRKNNFLINGCPFKRKYYMGVGGTEERPLEDWHLWAKMFTRYEFDVQNIESRYNYHKSNTGLNHLVTEDDLNNTRRDIKRYFANNNKFGKPELVPYIRGYKE